MSPSQKSKSKSAARAAKEPLKTPSKPAASANGLSVSEHNLANGTLLSPENMFAALPMIQTNGDLKGTDEAEEHLGSSHGTNGELDSLSTNGSCSGESEDPKEKAASMMKGEQVPGFDSDKREKIRQKNERKHQRQKERRAQELHDRCCGYLMSRKLEVLSQQLVGMGFTQEQATMALIQNEGRPAESVHWLFEVGEESKQQAAVEALQPGGNLKIDISDELAKIADFELKYKCSKQEVERAVVASEGDLEKAEASLKSMKQEADALQSKAAAASQLEEQASKVTLGAPVPPSMTMAQSKGGAPPPGHQMQRMMERDFGYPMPPSTANGVMTQEMAIKNAQSLARMAATHNPDRGRPQPLTALPGDKRWSATSSSALSIPSSLPSPLSVAMPAVKQDPRFAIAPAMDAKSIAQMGMGSSLREPVIMMQRPQSVNGKPGIPSTSLSFSGSPPASNGWYNGMPSGTEIGTRNGSLAHGFATLGMNGIGMNGSTVPRQFPSQSHFRSLNPLDPSISEWGGIGGNGSWNSGASAAAAALPSSLSVPSSLGLFSGRGGMRSLASPGVDWSCDPLMPRDYTSIDWSLDTKLLKPTSWGGRLGDTWSTMFMGGQVARHQQQPVVDAGDGFLPPGSPDDAGLLADRLMYAGLQDWKPPTSVGNPQRKFVTPPPL